MATINSTNLNDKTTSNSNQNHQTEVQKFKAVIDKLRLEIQQLRQSLQNEKHAVRTLKAQNEKELRKYKSDLTKKEQQFKKQISETLKTKTASLSLNNNGNNETKSKNSGARSSKFTDSKTINSNVSDKTCGDILYCENCQKFKKSNKELEERLQNAIKADRLKAADLRTQHENHITELSRLQRSTRLETQRLLEELKTKDRLIDQLRRSLRNVPSINLSNLLVIQQCTKSTQTTETMRKLVRDTNVAVSDTNSNNNKSNETTVSTTVNNIINTSGVLYSLSPPPPPPPLPPPPSPPLSLTTTTATPIVRLTNTNNNCTTTTTLTTSVVNIINHCTTSSIKPVIEPRNITSESTISTNNNDCCHTISEAEKTVLKTNTKNSSSPVEISNTYINTTISPALNERLLGHVDEVFHPTTGTNSTDTQKSQYNEIYNKKDEPILKEENRSDQQSNKHRKEVYYRPLMDLEPVVEEDTDSAVSSAPSSLSPQPFHHVNSPHQLHIIPNFDNYENQTTSPALPSSNHNNILYENKKTTSTPVNINTNVTFDTFHNHVSTTSPKLSSATSFPPTSLSPQPSEDSYTSSSPAGSYCSTSPITYPSYPQPPNVWFRSTENSDFVMEMNDENKQIQNLQSQHLEKRELESELAIAKRQVRELERALLVTREVKLNNTNKQNEALQMALTERIRRLEAREATLLAEIQELREQNELQEFRILELEECHEKWSLRSQSSSELRDIESSRVTPLPQDMLEYKGDVVREHLITMSKKTTDPDDKHCLQQVLTLLDNLETLSQEHANCLEEYSGEFYSGKFGRNDNFTNQKSNGGKLVPTVLPYMDCGPQSILDLPNNGKNDDDFTKHLITNCMKKKQLSNASSLQESGIFEGDIAVETNSVETQTDSLTSKQTDLKLSELTAEIQKLNQIRESIEEGKKCPKKFVGTALHHTKELDYYKNRLEMLENKVNIYESSGDAQIKKLKERLNHEILLTTQVKELSEKVNKLERENKRLEEEKCEFEEAENDTRLRYQQLEMELKLVTERLRDVEEARSANKRKAREAKALATYWESMFTRYEERNYELEEREADLQCKIDFQETVIPILIVFNLWTYIQNNCDINCNLKPILPKLEDKSTETNDSDNLSNLQNQLNAALTEKSELAKSLKILEDKYNKLVEEKILNQKLMSRCSPSREIPPKNMDYIKKVQDLLEANKEMKRQLERLEQREITYFETLQQADNIWAEMESGYKRRIQEAEENESQLRIKVRQLEENEIKLRKAGIPLNERIAELEDTEKKLEERIRMYEREHKYLIKENVQCKDELNNAKLEWRNMKENLEGSLHNEMDRLRKKIRQLQEEIDVSAKVLEDTEDAHQKEVSILKMQLNKTNKELVHLDITNSELREEITQLETRISELQTAMLEQRIDSERTIKNLTTELTQRDRQFLFRKRSSPENTLSLREELVQKNQSQECNNDVLNFHVMSTST